MRRIAVAFVACLSLMTAACAEGAPAADAPTPVAFGKGELTIITATGPHHFDVEIAETPEQRERGLMYRTEMAPDAGMIFNYHRDTTIAMWMKNTVLPLDMVFIRADGTVFGVAKGAVPYSETVIQSGEPVRAVLEINAGVADKLQIKGGDVVQFKIFGNVP